jgi:hypothetical protein
MPNGQHTLPRFLAGLIMAVCLAAGTSASEPPSSAGEDEAPVQDDSIAVPRDEVLNSPAWQETKRAWDEWLFVQKRYDKQQVEKLKQQLMAKVQRMSPQELDEFMEELQARLHILMGDEARDARRWLADTLSVASEKYAKRVRSGIPNVANLSAAELRTELDQFEQRRGQTREASEGFRKSQQDRVKAVQADLRRQHDDSKAARERAAQGVSRGGNFVPSSIHDRKSFSDRPYWGGGIGWW